MNLKRINIENFKCFKSEQSIDIGRLTLLTGANSSGKSSLMYSILGTIQSGEFPYQFSTNGKYVDMGDFNEISFGHDEKSKIKTSYKFENGGDYEIQTIWGEDTTNKLPRLYELKASANYFSISIKAKGKKYIADLEYYSKLDPANKNMNTLLYPKLLSSLNKVIQDDLSSKDNQAAPFNLETAFEEFKKDISLKKIEIDSFDLNATSVAHARLKTVINTLSSIFKKYDANINFISSFRLHPDRTYLETSKSGLKVKKFGEGYLDQIILWESKKAKQFKELIKIMKSLSLLDNIQSKRMDGGRFEMLVKTKKTGVLTSLSDVGFGVSQFLPIIVADLQLANDSTLFVAQPEIHLHPSVQSSFGDYITNQINKTRKNYIVETHSEYLINRIRLAVVKGELSEEDIHIYFLESTELDTIVHKILFKKDGKILNAPPDFFKTYMMDVMEIAINATG